MTEQGVPQTVTMTILELPRDPELSVVTLTVIPNKTASQSTSIYPSSTVYFEHRLTTSLLYLGHVCLFLLIIRHLKSEEGFGDDSPKNWFALDNFHSRNGGESGCNYLVYFGG